MNIITHEVRLDLSMPWAKDRVYTFKNDVGSRQIRFVLTKNNEPYVLSADASAYLIGETDGDETVFAECICEGNVVTAPVTQSMTSQSAMICKIRILNEDGAVITTPAATVINISNVSVEDEILFSADFNALLNAIRRAEGSRIADVERANGALRVTYQDGTYTDISMAEMSLLAIDRIEANAEDSATILKIYLTNGDCTSLALPHGANGKSAYQYARESGYTGTEAQFATHLATEYLTSHQDISGKADKSSAETWTFTLEDGTTVTKRVVLA